MVSVSTPFQYMPFDIFNRQMKRERERERIEKNGNYTPSALVLCLTCVTIHCKHYFACYFIPLFYFLIPNRFILILFCSFVIAVEQKVEI